MGKLLALDLSTTCTGYALFETESKALLLHGFFRPRGCGLKGLKAKTHGYPKLQLMKMQDLSNQILEFIQSLPDLDKIAIEEINRGVSRLGQKTLDGFHFILADRIENYLPIVVYKDSDGRTGWRTHLKLVLNDGDKIMNKQNRAINAKLGKGQPKRVIINKKHLACQFVNKYYGLALDCDVRESDGDEADAIGLGTVILDKT